MPLEKFRALGLSEDILKKLEEKGFEEPTQIQKETIPLLIKEKQDIVAQSQTGTGKTAAFGLPIIETLEGRSKHIKALIMTPTRELTIQVCEELNSFKGDKGIRIIPIYGGQSISIQIKHLRNKVDIVVGTPGRIIDHINRGNLDLSQLDYVILDEADEMLNFGFIEDIETIFEHTNPNKKTLLFSATMPDPILKLAKKYMKDHVTIKTKTQSLTTSNTNQIYFEVSERDKIEALCRIIDIEPEFYGFIFCRTKRDVDMLNEQLTSRGYEVEGMHGDMNQAQRERVLKKFRKKMCTILVVTDVAARGIDVSDLTHVINFAIPQDPESYVHRIGRTGRAGKSGTAITFITPSESRKLLFIQKKSKSTITKGTLPKITEIIAAKKQQVEQKVSETLESGVEESYQSLAQDLIQSKDPIQALSALLKITYENELNEDNYAPINQKNNRHSVDQKGKTRLFVAKGRMDNMTPKKLVMYLEKESNVYGRRIQDVQIRDKFSFISVSFNDAETILESFKNRGGRSIVEKASKSRK